MRHVVAALAIAAGDGEGELALLIPKIDGDAVDFRVGDVTAGDREAGAVGLLIRRIVLGSQFAATLFRFRAALAGRFQLGCDCEQLGIDGLIRPAGPFAKVGRVVGVVDREHRPRVGDRAKTLDRLATHALRGAIGRDELGMRRLQLLQFIEELVVFAIGDRRRGIDVVPPVVLANLVAKCGDMFFN